MKILVTGCAGFIGSALVNKLLDEDNIIVGIDSINNYYDVNLKEKRLLNIGIDINTFKPYKFKKVKNSKLCFIKMKLEDKADLTKLFKKEKFDVVIHLAAQAGVRHSIENPEAYVTSNLNGFMNILECVRIFSIKKFIFASSSSVYGLNEKVPFSTMDPTNHPISLYAATKKSNEVLAHSYSHLFNIPTIALRFFTVYGPWGRPDMAPIIFASKILAKKPISLYNYGNMHRDFTFIDDVTEAVKCIINNPIKKSKNWNPKIPDSSSSSAPFRIYNIGNNKPVNLKYFIKLIEQSLGKKAKINLEPLMPGDVVETFADIESFYQDYSYKPSVSIEEGVSKFIKWFLEYYNEKSQLRL
jgi:UDP-glucuronate 4-epimerase